MRSFPIFKSSSYFWLLFVVSLFTFAAPARAALTATLKVNGSSGTVRAKAGDTLSYSWESSGATSASSVYSADSDQCAMGMGPYPWIANSLGGSESGTLQDCYAGHTYVLTYTVKKAGKSAVSTVTVVVAAKTEQEKKDEEKKAKAAREAAERQAAEVVKSVQLDTNASKAQAIMFSGMNANGDQQGSLDASADVLKQGANHNATIGALYCAEGANKALTDAAIAATDIKSCQEQFASAKEMQAMQSKLGGSAELTPDPEVMDKEGSKITLAEYSANFGVSGDDFMKRMLRSGGSTEEYSSLLSSKLDQEKIDAALAAANEATAHEAVALTVGVTKPMAAKGKASTALRDSLRSGASSLIKGGVPTDFDRNPAGQVPQDQFGHLEPLENAFAAEEKSAELTLFQVVHFKYAELMPKLHR